MAKLETYKITYEDGEERFRQLDEETLKEFKDAEKSKTSTVKSVTKGTPEPINKERTAAQNKSA